jgi:hypothetical protein
MCRTCRLRQWASLVVVLTLLLGSPILTWAHSELSSTLSLDQPSHHAWETPPPWLPAAQPMSPATPGMPLTFLLFVLAAVAMVQGMWRWRRVTACALVLVLGTVTLGIAVHSVHHLLEPEKSAECLVLSASQHVSGTLTEPCDVYAPVLAVTAAFPGSSHAPTFILRLRSDLPRAPPPFLSQ